MTDAHVNPPGDGAIVPRPRPHLDPAANATLLELFLSPLPDDAIELSRPSPEFERRLQARIGENLEHERSRWRKRRLTRFAAGCTAAGAIFVGGLCAGQAYRKGEDIELRQLSEQVEKKRAEVRELEAQLQKATIEVAKKAAPDAERRRLLLMCAEGIRHIDHSHGAGKQRIHDARDLLRQIRESGDVTRTATVEALIRAMEREAAEFDNLKSTADRAYDAATAGIADVPSTLAGLGQLSNGADWLYGCIWNNMDEINRIFIFGQSRTTTPAPAPGPAPRPPRNDEHGGVPH